MTDFTCVALKGYSYSPCGEPVFKWLGRVPLCQRHHDGAVSDASTALRRNERAWEKVVYGSRDWDADAAEIVYYLRRESDGLIKIGTSAVFRARLSGLQGEHGPMQILLTHRGNVETERSMHRKFRSLRVEGEFFRPGKPLIAWIIKVRQRQVPSAVLRDTVPIAAVEALMS